MKAPISSTKAIMPAVWLVDKINNTTNALSTLRADTEQFPDAAIRVRDRPMPSDGNERGCSTSRISVLFIIAFALAVTAAACDPAPCPSGYPDPDWCKHEIFRGGG
jgi:hypothetical protein